MLFGKPIQDIIKTRKSVRSYSKEKISSDLFTQISNYLTQLSTKNYEFKLIECSNVPEKLGTYGFIKNAQYFIVALIDKDFDDASTFGYKFEQIILYLTSIGLATCWLGGTFNRKNFYNLIDDKNKIIPIVSPVGYAMKSEGFLRGTIRKLSKSDTRKPWNELFFDSNFNTPLSKNSISTEYIEALEMLRLSPSATNSQPWRILKNGDNFDFYISRTPSYAKNKTFDIQLNDIGISMCHFELTLNESNIFGNWIKKTDSPLDNYEYIISFTK